MIFTQQRNLSNWKTKQNYDVHDQQVQQFEVHEESKVQIQILHKQISRSGSSSFGSKASGYKLGFMERSKIRCYNYNDQGHFTIECKKPMQKKGKDSYDELKQKYEALLKKNIKYGHIQLRVKVGIIQTMMNVKNLEIWLSRQIRRMDHHLHFR